MKGSPWRTARSHTGDHSGASPTHAPAISGGRMELCRSRFPNANEVLVGRAWPPVGVHCLRTPRSATRVSFLCRVQRVAHSRLAHDEVGKRGGHVPPVVPSRWRPIQIHAAAGVAWGGLPPFPHPPLHRARGRCPGGRGVPQPVTLVLTSARAVEDFELELSKEEGDREQRRAPDTLIQSARKK